MFRNIDKKLKEIDFSTLYGKDVKYGYIQKLHICKGKLPTFDYVVSRGL